MGVARLVESLFRPVVEEVIVRVLLISSNHVNGALETPLPLGLACVAAATEQAGHEVRLLALASRATWEAAIQNAISLQQPEVIGISVRNIDDQNMQCAQFLLAPFKELVALCLSVSCAAVVLGGAGYSIFPESALAFLRADIGIQGEGEIAFPALLSWLETGGGTAAPPGVYLPNRAATAPTYVEDLDALPLPEPRLWLHSTDGAARVPVQSRRGCPLDCSYCSTSAIDGKPVRKRSPASVVAWMAEMYTRGFRNFHFVDNTFNLPPSYAKNLCRKLIESGLDLDWWAIIYPRWVDLELVQLMAKAGCTQVSLGFESGSESILQKLNKRFNRKDVQIISEMFADVGIQRIGFLLLGGPGETKATVEESLGFAESLHLDSLKITVGMRIYPNTPLASVAVAEGIVRRDDDLLLPRFYLGASVRDWLPERITQFAAS
jgi:radical SAM superfamily enzyme YgiQ (UPF0313 family)